MAKFPPLMIAIGMPHHEEDSRNEDNLDRERDGDGNGGGDSGDDDLATEAICGIARNLHHGGPSAVRDLRAFTAALEDMCETFMSKDTHGFDDAAHAAREALSDLIEE
jgi:hypothetical protein